MSKLFGWKNTIKTALTKKVLWITISFLIFTVKMLILLQRIFCINIATEHIKNSNVAASRRNC